MARAGVDDAEGPGSLVPLALPARVAELMRSRPAVAVWLAAWAPGQTDSFDVMAAAVGLRPLGRSWREIDRPTAEHFLTSLLRFDLAYRAEVMPPRRAAWLAEQFLASTGAFGGRFAVNSDPPVPGLYPWSWEPGTDFTCDAGIVVVGTEACALFWVADED